MKKAAPIAIAMLVLIIPALVIVFGPWQPWDVCLNEGDGQTEAGKERCADSGEEPSYGLSEADVADREEFNSDEDYQRALIESAKPQVEVPKEPVDTSGEGRYGYYKSILEITFYFEYGKARTQKVIGDCDGVWVSDTFEWPSSSKQGKATAEVYFPQCDSEDALQAMADELMKSDEVDYASFDTWFANVSSDGAASRKVTTSEGILGYRNNDVESPLQVWLDLSNFHQAWEKIRCQGEVEVAVLDSGIDLDHPDLVSNIGTTIPYDAFNMTVLQGVWEDTCGHGTEVSGIVSAVTDNGIGGRGRLF